MIHDYLVKGIIRKLFGSCCFGFVYKYSFSICQENRSFLHITNSMKKPACTMNFMEERINNAWESSPNQFK